MLMPPPDAMALTLLNCASIAEPVTPPCCGGRRTIGGRVAIGQQQDNRRGQRNNSQRGGADQPPSLERHLNHRSGRKPDRGWDDGMADSCSSVGTLGFLWIVWPRGRKLRSDYL
jgi:hypothetical protein